MITIGFIGTVMEELNQKYNCKEIHRMRLYRINNSYPVVYQSEAEDSENNVYRVKYVKRLFCFDGELNNEGFEDNTFSRTTLKEVQN